MTLTFDSFTLSWALEGTLAERRVHIVYQNLSEIEQFAAELGLLVIQQNFAVGFCSFYRAAWNADAV